MQENNHSQNLALAQELMRQAKELYEEIVDNRRQIHSMAELGMDLPKTYAFVSQTLRSYGLDPIPCGRSSLYADICPDNFNSQKQLTMLLRADMDALPMAEQSSLPFAATNGNCHSCGHDLHTAMLLGAAKLLLAHRTELRGRVRLMFQAGEEVLGGAVEMIAHGVLEGVDLALGMHSFTGGGSFSRPGLISYKREYSHFSGDFVRVQIQGRNAHGSKPESGIDSINIAAHIITGLEALIAREVSNEERSIVLVGKIQGGDSCNTVAGSCTLEVSVRAASHERRDFLKKRIRQISEGMAATFGAKAIVENVYGIGPNYNDPKLCDQIPNYLTELLGAEGVCEQKEIGGTEDFAAISERVPSIYLKLGTGSLAGESISHHNAAILFDESAMPTGSASYAYAALRYLSEHTKELV